MDCSPPGSSVHGISQARILEWVAISFYRGSSQQRKQTHVPALAGGFLTTEPPGKPIKWDKLKNCARCRDPPAQREPKKEGGSCFLLLRSWRNQQWPRGQSRPLLCSQLVTVTQNHEAQSHIPKTVLFCNLRPVIGEPWPSLYNACRPTSREATGLGMVLIQRKEVKWSRSVVADS